MDASVSSSSRMGKPRRLPPTHPRRSPNCIALEAVSQGHRDDAIRPPRWAASAGAPALPARSPSQRARQHVSAQDWTRANPMRFQWRAQRRRGNRETRRRNTRRARLQLRTFPMSARLQHEITAAAACPDRRPAPPVGCGPCRRAWRWRPPDGCHRDRRQTRPAAEASQRYG